MQVASVLVSAPGVCDGGRIETKPELCLVQLTSRGVGMDVLLVHNEAVDMAPYTDRAQLQRDKLVKPLFNSGDSCIAYIAKSPVDRSRERGVMEALTKFVQEHHTTANQAVRLFKVRCAQNLPVRDGAQMCARFEPLGARLGPHVSGCGARVHKPSVQSITGGLGRDGMCNR